VLPHRRHMQRVIHLSQLAVAGSILALVGCGAGSRPTNAGNFSGMAATPNSHAAGAVISSVRVASVRLGSAQLKGGASTEITVSLAEPAPEGGIAVQLKSSDERAVEIPATVSIPHGQTSATVAASTSSVDAVTSVAISAFYGNTVAGTSLTIAPATTQPFTIAVQPSTVTIAEGKSGSVKITTKISTGYNHSLKLGVTNAPAGVSVTLSPGTIPAPGAGTSKAAMKVASSAATGAYSLRATATDGKTLESAKFTLNVASSGPGATFQGCWYKSGGHRYQGVHISVADPGTYPFDAVLYNGTTCDPNQWADEFGYGTPIYFGSWIFWFRDFRDRSDMSALWHVGSDTSQCVNYEVAPDC